MWKTVIVDSYLLIIDERVDGRLSGLVMFLSLSISTSLLSSRPV